MYARLVLLTFACLLLPLLSVAGAETCVTADCHADYGVAPVPHQPVMNGECLFCHVQVAPQHPDGEGAGFELAAEGAELCLQCHDAVAEQKLVHAPVADGECLFCHQVHGGDAAYLLAGSNQSELCFECHDDAPFTKAYRHGPAAVGACSSCHDPHSSGHEFLLDTGVRDNCLNCHDDFSAQMKEAAFIHPPVKDLPCVDCHDPHAAENRFNLRKQMPALCFDCHPGVGDKVAGAKVQHQPLQGEGSCGTCHSTHFSRERGLLAVNQQRLCLNCHGADSRLENIEKQLEKATFLHGPLREGRCADCHDPHGSDFFRLLRGAYPEGRYLPYQVGAYDFCLRCHEKNLLRFEDTTLYTRFRNGNHNLHFVHVCDPRKGRTCRLCHESHASRGEKLISTSGATFGNWKVPTGFQPTATGGTCAPGCHQALSYDREIPVKNQYVSPAE